MNRPTTLADMDEHGKALRRARNARYAQKVRDAQNLPYFHNMAEASRIALSVPWTVSSCDNDQLQQQKAQATGR